MDEAIFVELDGQLVPARITRAYILRWYSMSFPDLGDAENIGIIDEAIEAMYTMWYGCNFKFRRHKQQTYYDKTVKLFGWLVCWYIADQYPMLVSGQATVGAIPLKSKKIGPITLTYKDPPTKGRNPDYLDLLSGLLTNSWGKLAYMTITGSADRTAIIGERR